MTVQKKERYTEAFARIDSSISSEHYFEAITIEESIYSDRIARFLDSMDLLKVDELNRQSFASLKRYGSLQYSALEPFGSHVKASLRKSTSGVSGGINTFMDW